VFYLGPVIWRAEIAPEAVVVECADKLVVSKARLLSRVTTWTKRTMRLFAADCAERALMRARAPGLQPDAWSLAGLAAERAVWAAAEAAWETARAGARETARETAKAAEEAWLTDRLFAYLEEP